jgi:hypothetical protein
MRWPTFSRSSVVAVRWATAGPPTARPADSGSAAVGVPSGARANLDLTPTRLERLAHTSGIASSGAEDLGPGRAGAYLVGLGGAAFHDRRRHSR